MPRPNPAAVLNAWIPSHSDPSDACLYVKAGGPALPVAPFTAADVEAWAYAFGDIIADPCCDAPCWIDDEGVVVYHRVTCLEVA